MTAFAHRHIGPDSKEIQAMCEAIGTRSLDSLLEETVPASIRLPRDLDLPAARCEEAALEELRSIMSENKVATSHIGMGIYGTHTPTVIRRNILENPGWYTAYTPYQAEISQGRMEALLNFQTLVLELTGMQVAGSSLLDEGTAAAEAMTMCRRLHEDESRNTYFIDEGCHPQVIAVCQQRAEPLGIEVVVGDHRTAAFGPKTFGVLVAYPTTDGRIDDIEPTMARAKASRCRSSS